MTTNEAISFLSQVKDILLNSNSWTESTKEPIKEAFSMAIHALEQLPSTKPEVIHCKDCKYSEHWYRDKSRCFLWHESGIDVFDDGFCNYAKRKPNQLNKS